MKRCFKCGVDKPLDEFYAHPQMADGHLNKCKDCTRRDVQTNYATKRERYSEYERERTQRPERKAAMYEYTKRRRQAHPEKYKAYSAVWNALRTGKLQRQPCEVCGTTHKVQAHHDDYSKPLEVRWLCFKYHREIAHGQVVTVAARLPQPR